jgi:hypothetical protein
MISASKALTTTCKYSFQLQYEDGVPVTFVGLDGTPVYINPGPNVTNLFSSVMFVIS